MLLRRWWCLAALTLLISSTAKAETPPEPARLSFKPVAAEQSGLTHVLNSDPARGELKYPWMSPPVDIDSDGRLDALVYGHHGGGAAVWLGRGDGTFALDDGPYTKRWPFGARDPIWWDVGDKAPHGFGTEGSGTAGRLYLNDGAGLFQKTALTLAEASYGAFQFADLDGDGFHREVYMTSVGSALRVSPSLEQWPTADATTPSKIEPLWNTEALVGWPSGIERGRGPGRPGYRDAYAVDLDGDDQNELIVHFRGEGFTPSQLRTWVLARSKDEGNATTWKLADDVRGLPQDESQWLFPEDLDTDGDLDLVDLHSGRWYANDGRGTFAAHEARLFDPENRLVKSRRGRPWTADCEIQWLDLDNDGRRDFLTASDHGTELGTFLNLGDGKFVETADVPGTRRNRKFGDVDGDGRLDMITFQKDQVTLHRNETKGNGLHVRLVPQNGGDAHLGAKLWVYEAGKLGDVKSLVHYRQGFMERDAGRSKILGGPLHVGLGDRETVDIRVRFPSGVVREMKAASAGREVVLREAE